MSKWISVKDRLPLKAKILGNPLSISGKEIPPLNVSAKVLRVVRGEISVGSVEWFDHGWINATHWKPLPEPPK